MNTYLISCDMFINGKYSRKRRMCIIANNIDDAYDMAKVFWDKTAKESNYIFTFDNFKANLMNYGEFLIDNGNFFTPYFKDRKIVNFDEFSIDEVD